MSTVTVNLKTVENVGVLHTIADKLYEQNYNIIHTHLFLRDNSGRIYMEITGVDCADDVVKCISEVPDVISVELQQTLHASFGKRVIVLGDGEVMAQTIQAAIIEAESHNMSGETISVDGMIIGGGSEIQESIKSLEQLPRVEALVLSGSMMGGMISDEIVKLKENNEDLIIISVDMMGDLSSVVDHVINDPKQAGIMAVKLISDKDYYADEILDNKFLNK